MVAAAVLLAPAVWHLGAWLRGPSDSMVALRDRVAALESRETALGERLDDLKSRVDGLDGRRSRRLSERNTPRRDAAPAETDSLKDSFARIVLIANRRDVNRDLTVPTSDYLQEMLGAPSDDPGEDCGPPTNASLIEQMELTEIGPVRVRMLRPAIASLRQVFANVQVYEPELHDRIRSAGALCVRRVRGSEDAVSAHAFGLAIDLNIDGTLDTLGDGKTQLGLLLLADFFRQEGWIWGAGFGREDSMHFEVSREKLETWRRLGRI